MNSKDTVAKQLRKLGLKGDEAKIYLELLREPSNHMRLAHATGINRTKVYRIAEQLQKQSLITRRTDDRGTFLVASDPSTLEVSLVNAEERLKTRRLAYQALLPTLKQLQQQDPHGFIVQTYEGIEGFKQMLWHELKTKGENLILGGGTIEDLVPEGTWAEKHRTMTIEAGYTIREILNSGEKDKPFTLNEAFMQRYVHRTLPREVLLLENQLCIYNDTVATYSWHKEDKVGFEIVNATYATMTRQVFEHYWQIAL